MYGYRQAADSSDLIVSSHAVVVQRQENGWTNVTQVATTHTCSDSTKIVFN